MGSIASHPALPKRLLIVDDEAQILEVLEEFLGECGYEVHAVSSGREALELVQQQGRPFDLALVDWNLPGIAGRDVITDLDELSPTTLVIVLTGSLSAKVAKAGAERAVLVMQKPFSLSTLARNIEDVLAVDQSRVCG